MKTTSLLHGDSANHVDFANNADSANHENFVNHADSSNHTDSSFDYAKLSTLIWIFCSCCIHDVFKHSVCIYFLRICVLMLV